MGLLDAGLLLLLAGPAAKPAAAEAGAVALVAGVPIAASELDAKLAAQLFALRTQEYELRLQTLRDMIGERLLASEAAARKLSVPELLQAEVEMKRAVVPEAEVQTLYAANKPRFGARPEVEAKAEIHTYVGRERRRAEFLRELQDRAQVRFLLEPPRLPVDPGDDPARGPKDAPITIVEFSDFQCPYCARVEPTLRGLEARYPGKLRIVFRDFPLPIHPQAPKAAEAAACAGEQGKYWEMHAALFANQQTLMVPDLKKRAVELGLDATAFDACLDSGRHEAEWKADQEAGRSYGVDRTGTPTFFINGRLLKGAQPLESFVDLIEDELRRTAGAEVAKR